jgi:electron-transferring-flavoprotein dehydrogenase
MPERETLDVDVLFVGAGPASLAGALHLTRLFQKAPLPEPISIALIEKGSEIGALGFSGAVMDPIGLRELMPDFLEQGAPVECEVTRDELLYFSDKRAWRFPWTPPPFRNHGNHIVSLSKLVRWLGTQVEGAGVDCFPGFAGAELLYEGDRVVGVRTGDKGIDKQGKRRGNHEPGIEIRAKITLLGEGPLGTLTERHVRKLGLNLGRNPQAYATGIKEVWEIPPSRFGKGRVVHTVGYPMNRPGGIGGGFLYGMSETHLTVGYVVWLNYDDPGLDLHSEFQRFKEHPYLRPILEQGRLLEYGAKAVPEGGYFAIPQLASDGLMILGDAGGLLNGQRLKGIHLAIKSGMLASETAYHALRKKDCGWETLRSYPEMLDQSWAGRELYRVRNFHQCFDWGFWPGAVRSELHRLLGGRGWSARLGSAPDASYLKTVADFYGRTSLSFPTVRFDRKVTFSKVDDVYRSGTMHEEDQPPHLLIGSLNLCRDRCTAEYANPCTRFCPAAVYETVEHEGAVGIRLNASNCVHCKTCEIKDPYGNITWVPPEGGGGPNYRMS